MWYFENLIMLLSNFSRPSPLYLLFSLDIDCWYMPGQGWVINNILQFRNSFLLKSLENFQSDVPWWWIFYPSWSRRRKLIISWDRAGPRTEWAETWLRLWSVCTRLRRWWDWWRSWGHLNRNNFLPLWKPISFNNNSMCSKVFRDLILGQSASVSKGSKEYLIVIIRGW